MGPPLRAGAAPSRARPAGGAPGPRACAAAAAARAARRHSCTAHSAHPSPAGGALAATWPLLHPRGRVRARSSLPPGPRGGTAREPASIGIAATHRRSHSRSLDLGRRLICRTRCRLVPVPYVALPSSRLHRCIASVAPRALPTVAASLPHSLETQQPGSPPAPGRPRRRPGLAHRHRGRPCPAAASRARPAGGGRGGDGGAPARARAASTPPPAWSVSAGGARGRQRPPAGAGWSAGGPQPPAPGHPFAARGALTRRGAARAWSAFTRAPPRPAPNASL